MLKAQFTSTSLSRHCSPEGLAQYYHLHNRRAARRPTHTIELTTNLREAFINLLQLWVLITYGAVSPPNGVSTNR